MNQRWKRLKRGKFGRVSLLKDELTFDVDDWLVQYWYLDGVSRMERFQNLNDALKSQRRFLAGGKP